MPVSCKHSTNIIIMWLLCDYYVITVISVHILRKPVTVVSLGASWHQLWKNNHEPDFWGPESINFSLSKLYGKEVKNSWRGKALNYHQGNFTNETLKRGCFPPHLQVATSSTKTEIAKCPSRGYEGFSEGLGEGFYLVLNLPEFKNYTIYSMPVGLCRFEAFPWKDSTVPDLSDSAGIKVAVSWEILLSQNKGRRN